MHSRLARGERGDVDEARHRGRLGGGEDRGGPGDVARLEPGNVAGIDHPSDVDDRTGAFAQPVERGRIFERAIDPLDPVPRRHRPASDRPDAMTGKTRRAEQAPADEPGRAGDRQLQIGDQ